MLLFEVVVGLLLVGAALSLVARKVGAPYPALVALAGVGLAFVPGLPTINLDPELALALFIAPVLLDAAFDTSPRDLAANWRPITSLALGAVGITVLIVAVLARAMVPEMAWSVAIALGAIVAPPDAASATTVLRALRPPHRMLVILEGESLFNDASALLIYRLAVAAAMTGAVTGLSVVTEILLVTIGSVILGVALSKVATWVTARMDDVAIGIVVQFCMVFAVWIIAERLHLSGIITIVVFAMTTARLGAANMGARLRVPAWAVWEVAVFVLNVLAFVLVGLQLKSIIGRTSSAIGLQYALFAAAICGAVIVARLVWVMGAVIISRWVRKSLADVSNGSAAVVGWSGMRGTVTLATALALPEQFPHRDLILATAFGVTLGTLVLQGLTLRPLIQRMNLHDDGTVEREVRQARFKTLTAAMAQFSAKAGTSTAALIRQSFQLQFERAQQELASVTLQATDGDENALSIGLEAQRAELRKMRSENLISDLAFNRIQEELDWMELGWSPLLRNEENDAKPVGSVLESKATP